MYFAPRIAIDILLSFMIIGIPLLIKQIIEYTSISIELNEGSVNLRKGFVNKIDTEVGYTKINAITVKKGLLGSMLGYGDILITTGNDINALVFKGIENPDEVKRAISSK